MAQIRIQVTAGGTQIRVAEPGLDDVDIHPCFQEVHGGGVAQAVGREGFGLEAIAFRFCAFEVFGDEAVDTETGESLAALVDEEEVVAWRDGRSAVFVAIRFEDFAGGGPQRDIAIFVAFAGEGDELVGELEPREPGIGDFLGARAGIVEEGEDGQIAESFGFAGIDLGEEDFKFRVSEVGTLRAV